MHNYIWKAQFLKKICWNHSHLVYLMHCEFSVFAFFRFVWRAARERESIRWIESFDRNKLRRDSEDFSSNLLQFAYSFRWPPKEFNRNIFCVFTLTLVRNIQSNFLDRNKFCCCTCERVSDHFKSIFGVEKSTQIKTEFEIYTYFMALIRRLCEMNFY